MWWSSNKDVENLCGDHPYQDIENLCGDHPYQDIENLCGDHPLEDLAKSGYKPNMMYKSQIILLYFGYTLENRV
jgi:hypothetical protein